MDGRPDPPVITEGDLEGLNNRALLRTLELARRASTAMLVVAGILILAWVWMVLRSQGVLGEEAEDGFTPFFVADDLGFRNRIDFIAVQLDSLGTAVLIAGLALGVRVYCDASILRAGGSLTGWELGNPIDRDPIDLDEV